jgi:AcrR family transcriptional regulator
MSAPRGPAVRAAVLAAALAELADRGYAGLTFENVAARADVHKTTVYRRWADRESLLTDALLEQAVGDFEIPDTGDIDTDLGAWLLMLADWLSGPVGQPLVSMLRSDAARLPAVTRAKARFFAARSSAMAHRLQSATTRGQLPTDTSAGPLLSALVAPLYLSLLVLDRDPGPQDCERAARIALTAARAGLLS